MLALEKAGEEGMRTAGKVLEARTFGKGLKEGRVTLRYLAVLPLRREKG